MDTMSTVDAYEKTPSGAHKITFLGGAVAGTRDDEIGALAEKLAGDDAANPVAVVFEKIDGRVYVKAMKEIEAPEVLGGPADDAEAPAPAPQAPPSDAQESAARQNPTQKEYLTGGERTLDEEIEIASGLSALALASALMAKVVEA